MDVLGMEDMDISDVEDVDGETLEESLMRLRLDDRGEIDKREEKKKNHFINLINEGYEIHGIPDENIFTYVPTEKEGLHCYVSCFNKPSYVCFRNGVYHRVAGPSTVHGKYEDWNYGGVLHRDVEEGPAVRTADGEVAWYVNGTFITSNRVPGRDEYYA